MNRKVKELILALMVTLPMTFVLFFFGYLPPKYDLVIYTNHIVGEGTCSAYLSSASQSFAYLYKADAYFGSELKTLRMQDLRYDVNAVTLSLYGIEEADFLAYDIAIYGFTVLHHNSEGDQIVLRPMTIEAVESDETSIGHLVNENPDDVYTVDFTKSIGIPTFVWIIYFLGILLIAVILSFGLTMIFRKIPGLRLPFLSMAALFVTMIMGCWICGSMPYVDYKYFLLNWLLLFAASILVGALTLPQIGISIVSFFSMFWYIANYYVISFRSKPVMPADLKAMGTASEVAGSYNLVPNAKMIFGVVLLIGYLAVIFLIANDKEKKERIPAKKSIISRVAAILASIAIMYIGTHNSAFNALNSFQWDSKVLEGFHREGMVLTYIKSALSAHVPRPEGYSREIVNDYLREYKETDKDSSGKIHPTRIIMIMNEAFSDLRTVGMDSKIDIMPFIDSLQENTVQGNLYVSVIGGGTCNTEFEALTGNTLAFLGAGAYPYTENVTEPMFSLASYFRSNGYLTEAFHANEATNWNRNIVYPNLGFDDFYSISDYPELIYLHKYVADISDYQFIEVEDNNHKGRPRFLFDVTIQNHADYDHFFDVEEAATVKENGSYLEESARVYLSLIKTSDDEIMKLVQKYKDSDEPTMIVFFGDHQPYLGESSMEQIYTNINSQLDYFKSKFFIWTNYNSEYSGNMDISANYFPWLILEKGNFPLPPYIQMLKELYIKYPIFTSQGIISSEDGKLYDSIAQLYNDPLIKKYQYIQYANLFDEINPAWFEVE